MTTLKEAMAFITEEPKEIKPKKYKATAYVERCLRGAIDGIDTDDEAKLDDFVWKNCQAGYTCEVTYNESGERKIFHGEKFTTETMSVEDLLEDLRLEQQEQM